MEIKYNGMFAISPIKRIFHNQKTGETTHHSFNDHESLDIRNENIYDLNGNLIKEETQKTYNTLFLLSFDRAHVLFVKKFLDYQFEKTPIKEDFINYLEYGIYPSHIIKGGIKNLMADWIKDKREILKYIPQQTDTKTNKLKVELGKYGFFELSKVKQLSEPNKQRLIELISSNDLPYSIAMIEYLGFIKHLKAEHYTTDYKLFKVVANWFEVNHRAIKGNINVLKEFSKENRKRYTADQQKQTVQKNYEALK
jgi:hypothetical protein